MITLRGIFWIENQNSLCFVFYDKEAEVWPVIWEHGEQLATGENIFKKNRLSRERICLVKDEEFVEQKRLI